MHLHRGYQFSIDPFWVVPMCSELCNTAVHDSCVAAGAEVTSQSPISVAFGKLNCWQQRLICIYCQEWQCISNHILLTAGYGVMSMQRSVSIQRVWYILCSSSRIFLYLKISSYIRSKYFVAINNCYKKCCYWNRRPVSRVHCLCLNPVVKI